MSCKLINYAFNWMQELFCIQLCRIIIKSIIIAELLLRVARYCSFGDPFRQQHLA